MHTLQLAITVEPQDRSFDAGAEAEYLVEVLRVFGFAFGHGQTIRAMNGPAVLWSDPTRKVSLRLQSCEGGNLLVVTASDQSACEDLYYAIADRLPVLRLDVPLDSYLLPWLTGARPELHRARLARGTLDSAVEPIVIEIEAELPGELE